MSVGILGKKLGMTQMFDNRGSMVAVTVVQAGPCPVVQKKTHEKDGYTAIQIGFEDAGRQKAALKPYKGHFKSSGLKPQRVLKEIRYNDVSAFSIGQSITVGEFKPADKVVITGVSKGRGFQGVIRRHGFAGKDTGHGTHEAFRTGGSIGMRTPKHTRKNMKMAGHMGARKITTRNLKVMFVDTENNLLLIKGAIPGANNDVVFIRKA